MVQRPLKGSRISSFYPVKTLPALASLDSAFQLQEYISLLIRLDVHDVEAIVSLPGRPSKERQASDEDKENVRDADKENKNDIVVDEHCWVYEQLRRLAQDLSHPLITMLQQECTRATCPEMKAAEWLYLCVAHGNDGAMEQCCAIDYILHTLDSATALLNSPRAFPSRLTIPEASRRHFPSLARRLGRIFAHAYFHHREAFEQAEAESSLYARFLALTSKFDLVPSEFLVIPPRLSSMHDNEEGNERILETRETEEPRGYLSGFETQRGGSERWGLSDSSSVIDLAVVEDSEGGENIPDGAKKRWRSDTMVDRDTYLMGKKKREESLEKVFAEGAGQAQPRAADETHEEEAPAEEAETHATEAPSSTLAPDILDIVEPAPTEPHIPTSEPLSEQPPEPTPTPVAQPIEEEEELMKPPVVVPSQARSIPEPEPADPILEESPVPSIVEETAAKSIPAAEASSTQEAAPLAPGEIKLAPAEEESAPSADITTPEAATDIEPLQPSQSEETVDALLNNSTEVAQKEDPEEIPMKEEDVTDAKAEAVVAASVETTQTDGSPNLLDEEPKIVLEESIAAPAVEPPVTEKDSEEAVQDLGVKDPEQAEEVTEDNSAQSTPSES